MRVLILILFTLLSMSAMAKDKVVCKSMFGNRIDNRPTHVKKITEALNNELVYGDKIVDMEMTATDYTISVCVTIRTKDK